MADIALEAALKKRKELQDRIRAALDEIAKLEKYMQTHRELVSGVQDASEGAVAGETFGRAGLGLTQDVFESFLVTVLRDLGRPLQSGEVVDEFKKRGHAIGGTNETKQAWNRLWEAKTRNIVVHLPPYGYWLANEPMPASVAIPDEPRKRPRAIGRASKLSKKRGRPPILTPEMIALAKSMLLSGMRMKEVSERLGGVGVAMLRNRFSNDPELFKTANEKDGDP